MPELTIGTIDDLITELEVEFSEIKDLTAGTGSIAAGTFSCTLGCGSSGCTNNCTGPGCQTF